MANDLSTLTARNAIAPSRRQVDDGGLNALRAKLLMQQAAQQPAYISPGEPPAKAWAPVIAQLGSILAGKAANKQEDEKKKRMASLLLGLVNGRQEVVSTPNTFDGTGPRATTRNVPYTEQEKLSLASQEPLLQEKVINSLFPDAKKPGDSPSTVQEWEYYNKLADDQKKMYLEMKRNPNIMNLGGAIAVRSPGGGIGESYAVTPKPDEMPAFKGAQAQATMAGKAAGEQESSLVEMQSNLPRLETVVGQLSELGKTATYTKVGQAQDFGRRELGLEPRKEAIARKEYISKVDNEVLPLLRQTFGSAFTEKEGTSLKATLGDPNASPAEKEAVLKSFIDSKRAEVKTQRRKVGLTDTPTVNNQGPPNIEELLKKY